MRFLARISKAGNIVWTSEKIDSMRNPLRHSKVLKYNGLSLKYKVMYKHIQEVTAYKTNEVLPRFSQEENASQHLWNQANSNNG